jgi:Carboxypeptidase activation peptide
MYRLDFLRYNRLLKDANQVMVPPQFQRRFESDLKKHQMQYRINIDNVKR